MLRRVIINIFHQCLVNMILFQPFINENALFLLTSTQENSSWELNTEIMSVTPVDIFSKDLRFQSFTKMLVIISLNSTG